MGGKNEVNKRRLGSQGMMAYYRVLAMRVLEGCV